MPQHILAAILVQLDAPHVAKQQVLCLEYALANKLQAIAVCHQAYEALSMVMAGTVAVVISAIDPGGSLAADLERFGGRLCVVRESRRRRPDADIMVERMYARGLTTVEISAILEEPPEEVRRRRIRRNLKRRE